MRTQRKEQVILPVKEIIQQHIETWTKENYESVNICRYGEGWNCLSRSEEDVFAIHIDSWPRLLAYWIAYEVMADIYHHDLTRAERLIFKEYRLSQNWVDEDEPNFIQFAREFGLDTREAMALHWKQTFGLVRSGDITFKDETMIQTIKKTAKKILQFPLSKSH